MTIEQRWRQQAAGMHDLLNGLLNADLEMAPLQAVKLASALLFEWKRMLAPLPPLSHASSLMGKGGGDLENAMRGFDYHQNYEPDKIRQNCNTPTEPEAQLILG